MNIKIGKGIIDQINEIHEFTTKITKKEVKDALMSISTESFENLWKESFGESYEDFVNSVLDYDTKRKDMTINVDNGKINK